MGRIIKSMICNAVFINCKLKTTNSSLVCINFRIPNHLPDWIPQKKSVYKYLTSPSPVLHSVIVTLVPGAAPDITPTNRDQSAKASYRPAANRVVPRCHGDQAGRGNGCGFYYSFSRSSNAITSKGHPARAVTGNRTDRSSCHAGILAGRDDN